MTPVFTVEVLGREIPDIVFVTLGITGFLGVLFALTARQLELYGLTVWQTVVELFVGWIRDTVREVVGEEPAPYTPLIAGLVLFIGVSNTLSAVPFVRPPTADLSTTVALALVVFGAVPFYGIRRLGLWGYLKGYARPNPLVLPLNIIGELSRTLALAVRLFGNVMSAQMIGAILLVVAGVLVPVPLTILGLLTGLIQAYIFGILAIVYIAAAMQVGHASPTDAGATS